MDQHREDIDWQREECILLRAGLQENEDRTAELSVRGQLSESLFYFHSFRFVNELTH